MKGEELASSVPKKVMWRLIPLLVVIYIMAHLDRVNVSFAGLTMTDDLGFTAEVFGFGSGIFFFGYLLFEIPSNLILEKVGARRLIATIMIIWGGVSASMAWVTTPTEFYVMRFILGVAESGLYPGVILYLTFWFRQQERATAIALFAQALAIAGLIGSPLSGWILDASDGMAGMAGWQWLFILEGLPTVALAFVVMVVMTDRPQNARWLNDNERQWLVTQIAAEAPTAAKHERFFQKLVNPRVLMLSFVYSLFLGAFAGLMLWVPKTLQLLAPEISNNAIGWAVGLPYIPFSLAMLFWGRLSDRSANRKRLVSVAAFIGAFGFLLLPFARTLVEFEIALVILMIGMGAGFSSYWALVTIALGPRLAAVGIAVVNSAGALGSYASVSGLGMLVTLTGDYTLGYVLLGAGVLVSAVAVLWVPVSQTPVEALHSQRA
ncbi:MAG: MFS transporter [Immundisolibacteraceae bacterium]|nr:MFS transporter [Immundisolibacteraceae bacterium]